MIFGVPGQVVRLSTLAQGGVAITFHVPADEADKAYKAGQYVGQHMVMELRRRGLD